MRQSFWQMPLPELERQLDADARGLTATESGGPPAAPWTERPATSAADIVAAAIAGPAAQSPGARSIGGGFGVGPDRRYQQLHFFRDLGDPG
jgi:hypothetical protein